jgi:CDP-diacylglycerol--glycerol-3-phosphate 3-phosphatidyltransferase
MFPLRAIISASVALRIHPNTLTLIGVLINVGAAVALGRDHFLLAGVIMIVANIFDFIDGKVAHVTNTVSRFGAFWDSTLDRFSDIALFLGLIYLYSDLRRTDYVMVSALGLMFSIMTSYARARAESLIEKCKVGFMERPERIVLFMIGAFTNRMAAILWVILVLSVLSVADRVFYTWRELRAQELANAGRSMDAKKATGLRPLTIPARMIWNALFWTHERATWQYDLMVTAILAFVWLTPPDWLRDPTASGPGLLGLIGL